MGFQRLVSVKVLKGEGFGMQGDMHGGGGMDGGVGVLSHYCRPRS